MKRIIFLATCILMISASKAIAQDDDNDGIINTVEISIGTDPYDSDTDNDGLLDGAEDVNQDGFLGTSESSPLDADTDDDGINDGEEVAFSLNNRNPDSDGDGLTDGLEIGRTVGIPGGTSGGTGVNYSGTSATWYADADVATKTDPLDADTDNDGISDGGEDRDRDGLKDATETNPLDADSDDDGLKDGDEDLDDDGILDASDTNPMNADTDGDGLNDGLEKGLAATVPGGTSGGSYALNRVSYTGTAAGWSADADPSSLTDPRDSDTDNDGLADGAEDADRDGLVDLMETDPNNPDSDNDGSLDGVDCNNLDPDIYQGAVEIPGDGIDQDCDGTELCYADSDDDGYRPDSSITVFSIDCDCMGPGEASDSDPVGDCDDNDATVHPGAGEIPGDGIDQDCEGTELCYTDSDDDGFRPDGSTTVVSIDCDCLGLGEASDSDPVGDCDDNDATVHPGAEEFCDGEDKNCDGMVHQSSEISFSETTCGSYTAPDGIVYTTSGIIIAVIPNSEGCDSTITINLTIQTTDVSVIQNGDTLSADVSQATYQWLDCNDNYKTILNETDRSFIASTEGNYAVEITQNGCVDTSSCYSVIVGEITTENTFSENILIYPNPTEGKFYLDLGRNMRDIKIKISDANGKVINSFKYSDKRILEADIEAPSGIYYIEIASGSKNKILKILKN